MLYSVEQQLSVLKAMIDALEDQFVSHVGIGFGAGGQDYPHPRQITGSSGMPTISGSGIILAAASVTPGTSSAYGSYTQLVASTAADSYILGFSVEPALTTGGSYLDVQIATGAGGSETVVSGEIELAAQALVQAPMNPLFLPGKIAVSGGIRIAVRMKTDASAATASRFGLLYIAQTDFV